MDHQYLRRTGGEAAPDAGESDASEIADLYASVIAAESSNSTEREGGGAAPDARESDAPEIAISMHLSSSHRKRRYIMHRDQRAHSPHHFAWPFFVPAAGRKLLILIS